MRVVNNPVNKHVRLADMAKAAKAIAGCNGGYFDVAKFTPLGVGIAQGVSQGALLKIGPGGALFGVRNGSPFIVREEEYKPSPEISDLVQCSPILVDQQYVFHNGGHQSTFRTFVMTDGEGQWAIGRGEHLTLDELAELLARPGLLEGFHVKQAMNLDGGPSTALWWRDINGQEHDKHEAWSVVNVILIVPK